jgi:hypothetical protein
VPESSCSYKKTPHSEAVRGFFVAANQPYITDLVVDVVLVDFDCMPGAALVLVVVDDLLMPEGVVMVLDLLMLAWLLVVLDDLLMPAGLVMVVVRVVVLAGACVVLVVIVFDVLLMVVAVGVVWALTAKLPATSRAAKREVKRCMGCEKRG